MQFVKPQLFTEAIDKIGARSPIGSKLTSSQWGDVPTALRERAFFSSQVESVRFLQRSRDTITDFLTGARDGSGALAAGGRADFVKAMQEFAIKEGLGPLDPEHAGTVQDITSEKRLSLIFDTNTRAAQEFGYWKQGQDPDVLEAFPASRFIRVVDVQDPRAWHQQFEDGVWLKSDVEAWQRINEDFGVPWGPWGWGCGHDIEDVERGEAEQLGLLSPGQAVQPVDKDFNDRLQSGVKNLDPDMRDQLKAAFGDQIEINDETARWTGQGAAPQPEPPPAPVPVPTPVAEPTPAAKPTPTPATTLDDVLHQLGLKDKRLATSVDMKRLLEELKEAHPVDAKNVISSVSSKEVAGALTKKGVRESVQAFLDFLPPRLVEKLPKLRLLVQDLERINGDYGMGGTVRMSTRLAHDPEGARRTLFHELMHWVHREGPSSYRVAITEHFNARTAGESLAQLPGYAADVRGKRDKWYEAYAGRVYKFEKAGAAGLEVPTRYIEWLTMKPAVQAQYWNQPEFRETLLIVLRGLF